MVSELVTNATQHSRSGVAPDGRVKVVLTEVGTHVRLTVIDNGTPSGGGLRARVPKPQDECGRGLILVEALTDRWGEEWPGSSRIVWAEWGPIILGFTSTG
ncbi:anti-sigma regulatory factor (Ser/Thr protein kinase) [Thermocatellispora tengchongensis]|uniref:Anti-sigma regulatory factor (Ser/Thr protein kinase) n=1 Tax=Thermocatellispora tengchongensis TaxID=1073253 RepID=A0A840P6N3_9ACTN|nr:anti-sigma regulatory factor (Ser/Thr protein kinase) [Thermocatellispora tengchongensis]